MKDVREMDEADVLQEFVSDVELAYPTRGDKKTLKDTDWPDLYITYQNAKDVLAKTARMTPGAKNPLKIKRFISQGELSEAKNVCDVLEQVGRLLDKSYVAEELGNVVFEAEDGVVYACVIEGMIVVADPDYVKDILNVDSDNEETED